MGKLKYCEKNLSKQRKTQAQDMESEPWVVRTLAYFKQGNTNQHSPK